jgi:hypothetical protein
MDFKIKKNDKAIRNSSKGKKYPFENMGVLDSFTVNSIEEGKSAMALYHSRKFHGNYPESMIFIRKGKEIQRIS